MTDTTKQLSAEGLQLDHAGGATLSGLTAQSLCVNCPDLINLDITDASQLTELVLSAPSPRQRHLRLRQVPNISRIRGPLAADGLGALVHIDSTQRDDVVASQSEPSSTFSVGSDGDGLHIAMPVAQIDAAWCDSQGVLQTFAFDAQPALDTYWQSVHLLRARNDLTQTASLANASANELIIIDFAELEPPENGTWLIHTQAELACLNVRGIHTLHVTGARALHVLGADTQFQTLITNSPELVIEHAPQLARIQSTDSNAVSLRALTMTHCSADELCIEPHVEQLRLKHARYASVQLTRCTSLQVHSCTRIKAIQCDPLPFIELSGAVSNSLLEYAQLSMNESIIRNNMADIVSADDEALTPLLQMVPMQTSGRDLYPAMLVLHKAFTLGLDINQIWTLRNTLNINHCKDRPRCSIFAQNSQAKLVENGPSHWRWKVIGDGCTEVWRIDFILWAQALEAGVTHAKQMRSLVGQSIGANEHACQAAAYVLQNHADILSTANWLQLLKQTYKVRKRDGHSDLFKLRGTVQKRFVLNLIKFATSLPATDDTLKRLVVDYIIQCYNIDTAERLAPALFAVHAAQLRARCMEKSRQPERFPNHLIDYALDPLNASNVPLHTRYLKLALAPHAKH